MNELFQCNACGGIYRAAGPDGVRYFHACPLVANPAHQPDPAKEGYDPREFVEREGHRDENIVPPPPPRGDDRRNAERGEIRSAGRGRTSLPLRGETP